MANMKFLVFLQNAWSPVYAGCHWPRRSWLKALHASRSGVRLQALMGGYGHEAKWYFENASPVVGDHANSFIEADIYHMRKTMLRQKPDIVIALGKEAHRGAMIGCADHKLVILAPHPASRVLTNDLYLRIGRDIDLLHRGFVAKQSLTAFKQERGRVEVFPDPWLIHESLVSNEQANKATR